MTKSLAGRFSSNHLLTHLPTDFNSVNTGTSHKEVDWILNLQIVNASVKHKALY